jgi:serine/threonine-protein kinase
MGEVYRAKDTKLGREVAIKVLLDALASDSERMARFEREARVLASLDHPNIAPIFGLEDSSDVRAIVMALIDGPTLAGRVASGPIPDQEAKAIARQIIEALEYAHERGVIHRDLKPANIKITPEGAVKVLDFGLAKVLEDDQPQASSANSPTLTLGHTRAGVILGTAAYMSPEQAVGKTADRRSDIFSFGAVLYEMLSGQRAFAGDTAGETLVSVAKDDPDWSKLPAGTSAAVVKLLRRCLVKDRKQRLQAIGEARIMLEAPEEPQVLLKTPQKSSKLPWIAAGLLAVGFIAASWIAYRATRPAELKPLVRLSVDLGPDAFPGQRITAVLSPDGQRIVFTGGPPAAGGSYSRVGWVSRNP